MKKRNQPSKIEVVLDSSRKKLEIDKTDVELAGDVTSARIDSYEDGNMLVMTYREQTGPIEDSLFAEDVKRIYELTESLGYENRITVSQGPDQTDIKSEPYTPEVAIFGNNVEVSYDSR